MTTVDRVVKIRLDSGLNQREFGEVLNIGKSLVSLVEAGKREYTSRTLADICEKFNVNPEWLESGDGEPYRDAVTPSIKLLKAEYNLDDLDVQIIEHYLKLRPIEREVFKDYIKKLGSS